jgi:hypothetical protein
MPEMLRPLAITRVGAGAAAQERVALILGAPVTKRGDAAGAREAPPFVLVPVRRVSRTH